MPGSVGLCGSDSVHMCTPIDTYSNCATLMHITELLNTSHYITYTIVSIIYLICFKHFLFQGLMSKPNWARIPKIHEHYSVYRCCQDIDPTNSDKELKTYFM